MLKNLLNFNGINWWTLLGGLGLNFVLTTFISIGGAFLAVNQATADFYMRFGPVVMLVVIFVASALAGFVVGKIADEEPLKHAFWSSLGAAVPLLIGGVLSMCQNPFQFMLAVIAVTGAMNGGMLAAPRRRHYVPPPRE